ncbi:MAG: Secretion system C-terminal sorting domain, partial [Bacteroidota bacterium]
IKLENTTNGNFTAVLNDKYTGKKTTINAATDIPFDVNPAIAASTASDRFNISFTKNTVTSVSNFSINGTNAQIKIQPNPIRNNTIIAYTTNLPAGKYTVTLYDINGKYIAQTTYNHYNNNFSWKLPFTINPGNYLLKWTGNNINTTIKIVVE